MREAVGAKGEETAALEEPEELQEDTLVMAGSPLSTDRAREEAGAPTGKAATAAGTTLLLEGRGETTDC